MSETLREEFERAVKGVQAPRAYGLTWGAEVVSQQLTGEVSVRLDDSEGRPAPAYDRVPAWYGLPGVFANVPLGARCKVSFDGGSTAGVYISSWDQNTTLLGIEIGKNQPLFQALRIGGDLPLRKKVVLEQPLMQFLQTLYDYLVSLQDRMDLTDTVTVPQLTNDQQDDYAEFRATTESTRAVLDSLIAQIQLPNLAGGSVADKLETA